MGWRLKTIALRVGERCWRALLGRVPGGVLGSVLAAATAAPHLGGGMCWPPECVAAWLQAAAHHVVCVEDVVALIAQYAADEEARREARARVGARVPVVALLRRGGGRVSATRYTARAPHGLRVGVGVGVRVRVRVPNPNPNHATRYTARAPHGLRDAGRLATLLRRGPLLLYDDCYDYDYNYSYNYSYNRSWSTSGARSSRHSYSPRHPPLTCSCSWR